MVRLKKGPIYVLMDLLDYLDTDADHITAFNVAFDRQFLDRYPWRFHGRFTWAPCVMLAAMDVMEEAKPLEHRGAYQDGVVDWKYPRLAEAAVFFGIDQQAQGAAPSALADARTAALIHIALQEQA